MVPVPPACGHENRPVWTDGAGQWGIIVRMRYGAQASIIGLLAMAYVVWRPVSSGQILYPVLALIAVLSVADIFLSTDRARRRIPQLVMAAALLTLTAVVIGAAVGTFRDTPGMGHQATVWLGGLVIWGAWAWAMDLNTVRRILTAIVIATGVLSAMIVMYIGANLGYIPQLIPAGLLESQAAGFDGAGGGAAVRFYGLSSLTIVAPMTAAGAMLPASPYLPSRRLMVVVTIFTVLAALIAGRRAIAVVIVITPLLVWIAYRFAGRRGVSLAPRIPVAVPLLAPFAFLLALWFSGTSMAAQVSEALQDAVALVRLATGGSSDVDNARGTQATELLAGWSGNPVFGAGLGAELASGYTRSSDRSWSFELQYHLLLFNLGLVGVVLLFMAALCVAVAVRQAATASPDTVPVIVMTSVGAVSILIANASNPYLQAVGHQWGVALALGVVCAVLRDGSTTQDCMEPSRVVSKRGSNMRLAGQ